MTAVSVMVVLQKKQHDLNNVTYSDILLALILNQHYLMPEKSIATFPSILNTAYLLAQPVLTPLVTER